MLLEILIFSLIGISAGCVTGLIPGIHINLIGISLIALASKFPSINPLYFVTLIVSMSITHTFLDFIPSVFLGCPDTDTELSILPGHRLLKKGYGYAAINLTNYGSIGAIILFAILALPFAKIIYNLNHVFPNILPYVLIFFSIFMILLEKEKINATKVFIITGLLGLIILNLNLRQPLLPLLSGLFGAPLLIRSIKNNTKIPKQKISELKVSLKKPLIASLIASPLCSFLPGMGSGQAAVIANTFSKLKEKEFLILIGATNTFVMGFSFIALYTISKTRTGTALAIKSLLGSLSAHIFYLIIFISLVTGIIAFFLTKILAKKIALKINKIKYRKISIATILILILVILAVSGFSGFLVFILASLTGIYSTSYKIRRTNMMGCLLIPTILLHLKIF